jgi:hypothetical protein
VFTGTAGVPPTGDGGLPFQSSRLALHWDRGRLARLKRRIHSKRGLLFKVDERVFDAGGRDARGPSEEVESHS